MRRRKIPTGFFCLVARRSKLLLSLQGIPPKLSLIHDSRLRCAPAMKMRPILCVLVFCTVLKNLAASYTAPASEWKALFNGTDLSNWEIFVATPNAATPVVPDKDSKGIFKWEQVGGTGALHVSGEGYGGITTRDEFDNFHFRVDFKWGVKRWPPREDVGRDSGILYCGTGQPNPGTGWLTSVENNVMEKGVGQWWSVNGAIIDCEGEWITPQNELYVPYKKEGAGEQNIVWKRGGQRLTPSPANGITPPFDVERVFGNWNTAEVIFWAGHCIHILNGQVNLVAVNPRFKQNDQWVRLGRGRIQLQSEGAEVYYRKAEVRPLYSVPTEYLDHLIPLIATEEGFVPLFSENATKDWKQCGPGSFSMSNGVASAHGGMGLWWYSAREFTNFVMRGEFIQQEPIADSGVFVRFPDPGADPWNAVHKGHEMEIGDPNPQDPTWRTGSIYPFHASATANTRAPGEWNSFEIVCLGHNYSVRINDRMVTAWTDTTERSDHGFVGLQNYNDGKQVRFRKLRIYDL
jgi:hypothetical protein